MKPINFEISRLFYFLECNLLRKIEPSGNCLITNSLLSANNGPIVGRLPNRDGDDPPRTAGEHNYPLLSVGSNSDQSV